MTSRRFRHAPRPIEPACPVWCTVDHQLDIDIEDGIRLHGRAFDTDVELIVTDDLEAGTRTPAEIVVRATSGGTARWARRIALAVLDAADHLEGGAR